MSKTTNTLLIAAVFALFCGAGSATAQLTIKIPKIKGDRPTADKTVREPETKDGRTNQVNGERKNTDSKALYPVQRPNATPVFLKNTLYVQAKTHDEYWKMPNQRGYSSWVPQLRFDLFYNNEKALNYKVEYFNPDGSAWYAETLEQGNTSADRTVLFQSPSPYGGVLDTKSTAATGVFSFKITDQASGALVYQGKFKVGKVSRANRPEEKNKMDFYVEQDWLLPFAAIGFHHSNIEIGGVPPLVSVWLRGAVSADELEARLFYQGKLIGSTKDAGGVSDYDGRATDYAPAFAPQQMVKRWQFQWRNFLLDNNGPFNRENYPNAHYADKNPGEYTVKIYRGGAPIRELVFTVGPDGRFVRPAYAERLFMPHHHVVLPVRITDPAEKLSPTWKADAFYANPLEGFSTLP